MRHLNKIIFINSATIQYQEISIDGNVHFIGTQGAGKSTVLRAILFFYNADINKLGIPKEKQGFTDYYFANSNSYIVYEVLRESGPFCILAYKQSGRVAYRFIDSHYDVNYFITDNNAVEGWDKVRMKLDELGIDFSKKIGRYEEYRNIIYGNNEGKSEFKKYALLESKLYQNIPRTIQNVFLNTKLDAEFIKKTIIDSIMEENVPIDLGIYRHHLQEFENEYKDIETYKTKKSQERQNE
ncbi:MAG: ATP-binding protein [Bacteroidetes bacterium]|nr:ATP-binding protein [Bacteroidota bacterium]